MGGILLAYVAATSLWSGAVSTPGRVLGAIGTLLVLGALARPSLLAPLNAAWTRLGILLGRIVSPIVMGLVFVVAVVPTALVMRLRGHDPLRRRRLPPGETYWRVRPPAEGGSAWAKGGMERQF